MKKFVLFFIFTIVFIGGCTINFKRKSESDSLNEILISSKQYLNTIDLAESVKPAIVGIAAESYNGTSVGAGVCVASGGIIITNSHVVNGSDGIVVYLSNGGESNAELLWEDTIQDLAIIKADQLIPYLPMSNNDELNVGEDVVAVGTPLSLMLKHSFTKGIVSAINRTLSIQTDYGQGYMQNLIQHDASLNPGNSGGPLLNLKGEVVGINTLKISGGEGIGFAIPSKSFYSLVNSVVASKTAYQTPYIGAFGVDGEIAKYNKLSQLSDGFYVMDIADNSPLKDTGIIEGCVITEFDGEKISDAADLRRELYKYKYGDEISLTFFDGERENIVKIKLEKNKTALIKIKRV